MFLIHAFHGRSIWRYSGAVLVAIAITVTLGLRADIPPTQADYARDPARMIDAYRHVETASISDAMEQLLHEKYYMSHKMQPIFPNKFAGAAVTVLLKKEENQDPDALSGMFDAIDGLRAGSVYVMKVEDGDDIGGMGGLMGTAMSTRGVSGAIIDGGVRDLSQLKRIGLPVYATGIVPSTPLSHYRFGGVNVPLDIAGTHVEAGDIIVADQDGVVVVPRAHAAEVLILAQKLDAQIQLMYPHIDRFHTIVQGLKFVGLGRI